VLHPSLKFHKPTGRPQRNSCGQTGNGNGLQNGSLFCQVSQFSVTNLLQPWPGPPPRFNPEFLFRSCHGIFNADLR
jgi:hypothetical protein